MAILVSVVDVLQQGNESGEISVNREAPFFLGISRTELVLYLGTHDQVV